jgi:hypothetical protein
LRGTYQGCSARKALKSVEDFTEFEQRGTYFDSDHVIATKKGANILEQVARCIYGGVQELLDFQHPSWALTAGKSQKPPRLKRGQILFFGKATCAGAISRRIVGQFHAQPEGGPFTTADDQWTHGKADGPIRAFPCGASDSSPTCTMEAADVRGYRGFFNLVLEQLTAEEKRT